MEYCWRCNNTVELDEAGHCPAGHTVRAPQGGWQSITLPETPLPPEAQPASAVAVSVATEEVAPPAEGAGAPRRSRRVLTSIVVAAVALVGVFGYVLLGGKETAAAALYRRVFVTGDTHRYAFNMNLDGGLAAGAQRQPINLRMAMKLAEEVLSVAPDGTGQIRYTISDMNGTANGQSIPLPSVLPYVTVRMAPEGKVLSMDWAGAPGLQSFGTGGLFSPGSVNPLLPPQKAAPGDSWNVTVEREVPFAGGNVRAVVHNTLMSLGTVGRGEKTATIRSTLDAPLNFRIDLAKLAQSAGSMFGNVPANAFPPGASVSYAGHLKMTGTQTIARATGRPLQMLGEGDAKVRATLEGVRGVPTMDIDFHMTMSFTDLAGGL
jgi:hypothetical protein